MVRWENGKFEFFSRNFGDFSDAVQEEWLDRILLMCIVKYECAVEPTRYFCGEYFGYPPMTAAHTFSVEVSLNYLCTMYSFISRPLSNVFRDGDL